MSVSASNALTVQWAATIDDATTVFTGFGVYELLALLGQAAAGPARDELLGVAPTRLERPVSPTTRLALGIWCHRDLPLDEWWATTVPASVRGTLTGDLAADKAALDRWAHEQTGGLIPRMPIDVHEDLRVVLATALTVKTAWAEPFEDGAMRIDAGPWAGPGLHAGLRRTGAEPDLVRVAATPSGQLTLLTVVGRDDVDVVLALGEAGRPAGAVLPAAIGALGSGVPGSALPDGPAGPGVTVGDEAAPDPTPRLSLTVPRFDVRARHDLLADRALFGLTAATDPDPRQHHFPRISPQHLTVDQGVQEALARFSATGFEAAAVTAIGMSLTSMPAHRARTVRVSIDRPFGFVAVHRPTGLVLVAGWVGEPEPYREPDFGETTHNES